METFWEGCVKWLDQSSIHWLKEKRSKLASKSHKKRLPFLIIVRILSLDATQFAAVGDFSSKLGIIRKKFLAKSAVSTS